MMESTVVLIKPDGVKRGLVGEIISRFERIGLKIVAAKMIWVDKTTAGKHYRDDNDYHMSVGVKTLKNYEQYGFDANENLGTKDPIKIGKIVRRWNMEMLSAGPVLAILLEGPGSIALVRKLTGFTFPADAVPGTIRGDFGIDSSYQANLEKRTAKSIIHASGSKEEAEFERKLWFKEKEIYDY